MIWRYFSWTNQTLAMIVLWAASMYLFKEKKNYWITAVPATFMSAVSSTYFILAPECLGGLLNSKTAEGANHLQHRGGIPHRRHLCHCNAGGLPPRNEEGSPEGMTRYIQTYIQMIC